MKIDSRSPTDIPTRRIGWFLRLAQQRRWFHESLFRRAPAERKPEADSVTRKSSTATRAPLE